MKKKYLLIVCITTLFSISCHGQKMMKTVNDASKIVANKHLFIGKPLKVLLDEIGPEIKQAYGNPENKWAGEITFFVFSFTDKNDYRKKTDIYKKRPTTLTIEFNFEPGNKRKPLPKGGITQWTDSETKEYGDMIIMGIRVRGKD